MHHLSELGHRHGRRIAVVGSGVAGLSAAWLLSRQHEVVLYEKNPWLGGHANTVDVDCPEGVIPVDTGFIVFNPANYPNFVAMLEHLGVPSLAADMSLGVSVGGGRLEYSSRPLGLFGQPQNLVSPRFWRMIADILAFYKVARSLDHDGVDGTSLGQFLERGGYSRALIEEHVLPMCAAIWSTTASQIRDYPMRAFLRFFSSHGLLQVVGRPQWRTVAGGSRAYVEALRQDMGGKVQVRRAARRIARTGGLVTVEDVGGELDTFTDVVIAAHADEAARLLADPSQVERDILGAFEYTPNLAVLHDDRSLMPRRRSVWASWNYIEGAEGDEGPLCVSYWMNRLQSLPTKRQLFVTLNPVRAPRPGSVIRAIEYTHPLFNAAALQAQDQLWRLQGVRNTWFCGSYFGYGFHEDALQSGLAVAESLGAPAPWARKPGRIATRPREFEPAQ
ncbi:FAD-dependent oxidoreductase [Devosia sp.]|uniref:NAD(P)/FAD-dependent oxidoreductase n=1 Tax=Devosia sp. TaxID=1871048 RepID=UPI0025BA8204|nr:FAD-dependent oxidoreductase [Devosia sp.]